MSQTMKPRPILALSNFQFFICSASSRRRRLINQISSILQRAQQKLSLHAPGILFALPGLLLDGPTRPEESWTDALTRMLCEFEGVRDQKLEVCRFNFSRFISLASIARWKWLYENSMVNFEYNFHERHSPAKLCSGWFFQRLSELESVRDQTIYDIRQKSITIAKVNFLIVSSCMEEVV